MIKAHSASFNPTGVILNAIRRHICNVDPILVIALMAALGWWRGVYRELIVSAAIVLSALVALQWATQERWALDLSNTFNGLGPGEWQFFLRLWCSSAWL